MTALVEVHDEDETRRAVDAGAAVIGVNARNLSTLEVDRDGLRRLRRHIPDGVVTVAESGVRGVDDVRAVRGGRAPTPCSSARPWSPAATRPERSADFAAVGVRATPGTRSTAAGCARDHRAGSASSAGGTSPRR